MNWIKGLSIEFLMCFKLWISSLPIVIFLLNLFELYLKFGWKLSCFNRSSLNGILELAWSSLDFWSDNFLEVRRTYNPLRCWRRVDESYCWKTFRAGPKNSRRSWYSFRNFIQRRTDIQNWSLSGQRNASKHSNVQIFQQSFWISPCYLVLNYKFISQKII